MKRSLLVLTLMLLPAAANAAEAAQPRQSTPARLDAAFLEGRWCEVEGDQWMRFDTARNEIDLPNGNSGTRVVGTYSLTGSTLSVVGPTGSRIEATLRREDARSMHFTYAGRSTLVRRC